MGGRLRKTITDLGLTQNEFAKSIGITPGGLSDILRGKTKVPSGSFFKAIEYRYGINSSWLVSGKGKQWITPDFKRQPAGSSEEITEIENIYKALDKIRQRLLVNFSRTLKSEQLEKTGKKK
jgi:transcriptional regulator with XRE-family HTH domain